MMYLFPRCERVGNCPVWSLKMVSRTSYVLTKISCFFLPFIDAMSCAISSLSGCGVLVIGRSCEFD